jgi:hypothetical protein
VQGSGVIGVQGYSPNTGGVGVIASAPSGVGLKATGSTTGVDATATASNGTGVKATGSTTGVDATATASNGTGVQATGTLFGVVVTGAPRYGFYNDPQGVVHGVYAQGTFAGGDFFGGYYGAFCEGTTIGVYGTASGTGTYGVFCDGDMRVTGTINPAAVVMKIDHPQAPERRWLSQGLVSSGEALNVQSGTATLDASGQATVRLPGYFSALTRASDLRYQLTPIGKYSPLYIAQEVTANRFRIAGGMPGQKVSWQVSGVRRDDYATAHPLRVETRKTKSEIGTRLFVPKGSNAKLMDTRPPAPPHPKRPRPGSGH